MTQATSQELEHARPPADTADDQDLPAILEEVTVEEISIDGMCSVY